MNKQKSYEKVIKYYNWTFLFISESLFIYLFINLKSNGQN